MRLIHNSNRKRLGPCKQIGELKERQAMLIEAATMVLERYAQTGNMVDADFEVIDQLKEIGVKIPARIAQKTLKQTNGVR